MPNIAIIERDTHKIATFYEDDAPHQERYGGPWGRPETTAHVPVPDRMDTEIIVAVLNTDGKSYTFVEDAVKVAAKLGRQWTELRAERTRRLSETDWAMTTDSPLSDATKMAVRDYRQALRDLPSSLNHPSEVVWPASPLA